MAIVEEDLERVRSATDLVALVSERVALRRAGARWVGLCPFHAEKTPSFSVNAELGRYYCFGCQAHGDAISFLRETEHLDFVAAVEALASRAGITLHYDDESPGAGKGRKRAAALGEAMEQAVQWYHERLLNAPDAGEARAYLRRRGYDSDVVRRYKLGWAPAGWDSLVRALKLPEDVLIGAGLAFRNSSGRLNDAFRARVLFPIFDAGGRAVALGGRVLPGGQGPKYKNTVSTSLYDKSKVLYGLNWAKSAIVERGQVVVCEGYTDVIGLHRCGVTEAVATCGTALAEGHVRLLTGFARRVVLAYDADTAGQGAALHFYDWEHKFDADIRVVALPPGADPADLALESPSQLHQAVANAQPYLGFRIERVLSSMDLASPEGRARAAELCLSLIADHPDPLVKDQYLMQVADRCHLSPDQLRSLKPARRRDSSLGRNAAQAPEVRASTGASPVSRRPGGPARQQSARVPPPEMEALRLAVQAPGSVAGRLHGALFSSDLARAAFEELVSSLTLSEAIEQASDPRVAELLGRLAVEESQEQPDDVLGRLLERAAVRVMGDLQRRARSTEAVGSHRELSQMVSQLKLALEELRSASPGPEGAARLAEAQAQLLTLVLGHRTGASA
ncbi:MAG: DNA primase [Acidimicrobiales bacterium]